MREWITNRKERRRLVRKRTCVSLCAEKIHHSYTYRDSDCDRFVSNSYVRPCRRFRDDPDLHGKKSSRPEESPTWMVASSRPSGWQASWTMHLASPVPLHCFLDGIGWRLRRADGADFNHGLPASPGACHEPRSGPSSVDTFVMLQETRGVVAWKSSTKIMRRDM